MAGLRQVINMANSIVGVSILSMPFCFKQTGLLLGVLLILITGFFTKKTCMFLIRSAIMARRRSYEFLAFHVFGVSGKLFVELCMILFLIGICISFHVVVGDLAPAIVARFMNVENSSSLRCTLLIGIAVLVILPLCLLRNLDNLASMSACSIMFYIFLITVIFWHAFPKLWDGTWIHVAELWRPAGALQVLPILSLALACQSNVFEIYDSVPDPDVPKMRFVVNHAVNLCSALYISVGFLGYVAFVDKDFSGNIIMSLPNSELTEGIKVFFTVSLAISFPLMIFPCRTSIHSLLYRRNNPSSYDLVGNYMPESRFKAITIGILFSSLVIGILIPNIEFVLGLLGSTMGMLIALILPSLLFIKVNTKASAERLLAQGIMLVGLMLIVTGTYLNLAHIYAVQAAEARANPTEIAKIIQEPELPKIEEKLSEGVKKEVSAAVAQDTATRKEPVAPEPPPEEEKVIGKDTKDEKSEQKEAVVKEKEVKKEEAVVVPKEDHERKEKEIEKESIVKKEGKSDNKNPDTLHPDAIMKEVKEEEIDKEQQDENIEQKQVEILEKMEVQHQEQQQILEEQKKILKELKDQKQKQDDDAKKQDEVKVNVVGIGNAAVAAEGQLPAAANPVLQQGVESLNANQLNPQLNQALVAPGAGQPLKPEVMAPVAPAQNQPIVQNLNNMVPVANENLKQPPADQNLPKINPQMPLVYYHNIANPPSAAIFNSNQQIPNANQGGVVGPAGGFAAQPVFRVDPAAGFNAQPAPVVPDGQGNVAVNAAVQPVPGGSNVAQPVASANNQAQPVIAPNYPAAGQANFYVAQPAAGQPIPAGQVNLVGQQAPLVNYVGQVNVAPQPAVAQQVPLGNYRAQVNIVGQPGVGQQNPAANYAGQVNAGIQPALVQQIPAGYNVGQANPAVPPAGVQTHVAGQSALQMPAAVQPDPALKIGAQPVVSNIAGQINPPLNAAGQQAPAQPAVSVNIANKATPQSNLAPQAVTPESNRSPLNNNVRPAISNKDPSIKFEDDDNLKEKKQMLEESISQKIAKKPSIDRESKLGLENAKEKNDKYKLKYDSLGSKTKDVGPENKLRVKKKTHHDEERRKRDIGGDLLLDPPEVDIMRELKWKDFGDIAYDTRHLLWTGRSRRKKRNKGRDEDYYWDET